MQICRAGDTFPFMIQLTLFVEASSSSFLLSSPSLQSTMLLLLLGAAIALLITAYTLLIIFSPEATPTTPNERLYASATTTEAPLSPLSDPPSCSLSVVVPAYNERERLPSMIDEAMRYLLLPRQKTDDDEEFQAWYGRGVEILIVDDGSGDDTAHVGLELADKWETEARGRVEIRVVRLEGNRGKGGAVRHVSCVGGVRGCRVRTNSRERDCIMKGVRMLWARIRLFSSSSPLPSQDSRGESEPSRLLACCLFLP